MLKAPVLGKLLLAACLLNAQLCPCPAMAANPNEDNGHHHMAAEQPAASDTQAEPMAECHGADSRVDCSMGDSSESDAAPSKQDRLGELSTAIAAAPPAYIDDRRRSATTERPPPFPRKHRTATPVTFSDRMLH